MTRKTSLFYTAELAATDLPYTFDPSVETLDLEALVNEAQMARELKKQQYLGKPWPDASKE